MLIAAPFGSTGLGHERQNRRGRAHSGHSAIHPASRWRTKAPCRRIDQAGRADLDACRDRQAEAVRLQHAVKVAAESGVAGF
jgi:hypothetical protein